MSYNAKIQKLFKLCQITKQFFKESKLLEEAEIAAWITLVEYSEVLLNQSINGDKLNSNQLKTIESELLQYWNNSLNIETEKFWEELEISELKFKRPTTYEKIIEKRRFKNVEQAIEVYNDIFSRPLPKSDNRVLIEKLNSLYEIVKLDRDKRIKEIRKWLNNQRVSNSERGKFGENYAYFKRTGLYEEIFSPDDMRKIEKLIEF